MDVSELKPCPICKSPASVMNTVFGWFAECKTLMNIAPTAALRKDGLCAYIDVVAGNELGEYI